jgi:hypothetical protein
VDEGKKGKLLSYERLSQLPQLSHFLQTDEHRNISWLHNIATGNFLQVSLPASSDACESSFILLIGPCNAV